MVINECSTRKEILQSMQKDGWALEYASERLKNNFNFLSEVVEKYGVSVLKNVNLLDTYEDLKLKHDMQEDLNTDSRFSSKLKKF